MNGVLVDPSFSPDAIICRRPANISLAMIFDVTGKRSGTDLMSRRQRLGRGHAVKFFNRIFTNITVPSVDPPFLSRTFWPPIFTDNCPNMRSHFDRKLPYQRGLLLAHKQIWEEFLYQYKMSAPFSATLLDPAQSGTACGRPKLCVFEDDAMEIAPEALSAAYYSVLNMTTHVHYLGYCWNKEPGVKPPLCCHAYCLTVDAVAFLLTPATMDWCVRRKNTLDEQLQALGAAGNLSWYAVPNRLPYGISDAYIRNKSLDEGFKIGLMEKWEGGEGGLIYQIKYEDENAVALKEGGVYKAKFPAGTVYLYRNSTLRAFPNINEFAKMGYELTQVEVIPRSQILKHGGPELPKTS